ncbi:hypothetical protein IWZ00DRAFT_227759 [Phyllosticta capitalensis]|uniref:Uncharacterized protein n=1 Tax=Phyllosticta capitalensis TaxID=121624 RepID=A0ABR1YRL4_9PEZI
MIQSQQQHHFLFSTFLLLALWSWPWPGVTFTSSSLPTGTAIDRKKNEFASPVSQSGKFGFSVPHGVPDIYQVNCTADQPLSAVRGLPLLGHDFPFFFFFLHCMDGVTDGTDRGMDTRCQRIGR